MPGLEDFDDIWDLTGEAPEQESGRKADHTGAAEIDEETRRLAEGLGSSLPDSELNWLEVLGGGDIEALSCALRGEDVPFVRPDILETLDEEFERTAGYEIFKMRDD